MYTFESEYAVESESDSATFVLVARPLLSVIEECNKCFYFNIYENPVNTNTALYQHNNLIRTLQSHNILVCDVVQGTDILTRTDIEPLQMANIIFTRDPVITTAHGVVLGNFREKLRSKEVDIFKKFFKTNNIPIMGCIEEPGCVEGGDFFPLDSTRCIIAVGMRTNFDGVFQMIEKDLFGTKNVAVVKYGGDMNNSHCVHLDSYFGMVGKNTVLLWEGAQEFLVDEYKCEHFQKACFNVKFMNIRDMPFRQYLENYCLYKVILVPTQYQIRYGCNVLMINETTVLTQEKEVTELLKKEAPEINTVYVDMSEINKMYGGIRCATQVILRRKY